MLPRYVTWLPRLRCLSFNTEQTRTDRLRVGVSEPACYLRNGFEHHVF